MGAVGVGGAGDRVGGGMVYYPIMKKTILLGALWGDICGVPYEFRPERDASKINLAHRLQTFSDDSVLTLAVAKAILERRPYAETIAELAQAYPHCGFGGRFFTNWIVRKEYAPYGSFGNGSAMRVSPVGWAFNTVEDVLREAEESAACTHNHPRGIAEAQAVALAVFLARKGQDKDTIRAELEERFGYELTFELGEVRAEVEEVGFDETWRAVPPALSVFLATESFEECLREAIALGGDADTQACIACSVAEAYYGVPEGVRARVQAKLDDRLNRILDGFSARFGTEAE